MTNEDIRILKVAIENSKEHISFCFDLRGIEALNHAIKALEQQPCENCVSREAAINVIYDYTYKKDMRRAIEQLPSVKPQTVTDFADKCKECGKILNETYQQKWIPVSERLPEEYMFCLITVKIEPLDCEISYEVDKARFYRNQFISQSIESVGVIAKKSVIAWMPLTEPYKEGSNGE